MTRTSTWLVLIGAVLFGILGLLAAARGDGVLAILGWGAIAVAVLLGALAVRRLADQAFKQ